jgi:hypothetical protein
LETVFSVWFEIIWSRDSIQSLVEAAPNTSTVVLRVVGGDEKGSLMRQKNMVMCPTGLGPENDCAGEDQQQL